MYMSTMQSCMLMPSECALWKSSIWPSQRSCTWPIFKLDLTHDLNYNCVKFRHSKSTRSWVLSWKRTDGQTDRHTNHIRHSCGILNNFRAYNNVYYFYAFQGPATRQCKSTSISKTVSTDKGDVEFTFNAGSRQLPEILFSV